MDGTNYRILKKETYSPVTYMLEVEAPDVAKASMPGQFVMVRHNERGERIPLTIADYDREKGSVTIVIQAVGKTTKDMMLLNEGDYILDFIGPLGEASHVSNLGTVIFMGGGLGIAPIYPQLRAFKKAGNRTVSIVGFRNKELVFWEERLKEYSDELIITTNDGSYGEQGLVTDPLKRLLEERKIDLVVAIGPLIMMEACAEATRDFRVKTIVSLNPIMIDGIGMCGNCRVTIDGETKFACIDGPDFDGHIVDFGELRNRQKRFITEEKTAMEQMAV